MEWFRNLNLARKFVTTFTLLLILLGVSLMAILFYLARINSYVERHTRITIPAVVTAADMRQTLSEMNTVFMTLGNSDSSKARAELFHRVGTMESAIRRALDVYRETHAARTHPILLGMLVQHHRIDLADQEDLIVEQIDTLLTTFSSHLRQARELGTDLELQNATELTGRLITQATGLIEVHTQIDAEMKSEGNLLLRQARLVILALVILLGLVIAATYAMVIIHIARPLSRLAQSADRITRRDLSAGFDPWPAKDEVGHLTASLSAMLTTLREQTQALEDKTKELESFTYSVAHDLKSPLREIEGFSSLLTRLTHVSSGERSLDETAHHYLHMIQASALRMTAFIDDLLQYSRLEQQALPKSRVNVQDMLKAILSERITPGLGRPPQVTIQIPFNDVWGEPTSIRQALVNLIDNAVKFSRSSTPSEIIIGGSASNGQRVLWIQDNGIGFDSKDTGRIFGLFERLHGPQEYEGTGAGLAIVKLVMEKHGGEVRAESSPGKGSTFYLLFPQP